MLPNEHNSSALMADLKTKYLNLMGVIQQLEESEDTGTQTVNVLGGIIHTINSVDKQTDFNARVIDCETTMFESNLLSSTSNIYEKCVEHVKVDDFTYDGDKFLEKLLVTFSNEEDTEITPQNWLELVPEVNAIINEVPKYSFLYGTFNPTELSHPKEKKERVFKERQAENIKQQIEKRENIIDKEQKSDQESFILQVLQEEFKCNGNKPIGYFDFVIDNKDFSTTIENMFYTSFLIRSGKAKFSENADEFPTIEPVSSEVLEKYRNNRGHDSQYITSIDMKDWEAIKGETGIIQRKKQLTLKKRKK